LIWSRLSVVRSKGFLLGRYALKWEIRVQTGLFAHPSRLAIDQISQS
jgi:hypothetical protein